MRTRVVSAVRRESPYLPARQWPRAIATARRVWPRTAATTGDAVVTARGGHTSTGRAVSLRHLERTATRLRGGLYMRRWENTR